jgi:hypothetical protein
MIRDIQANPTLLSPEGFSHPPPFLYSPFQIDFWVSDFKTSDCGTVYTDGFFCYIVNHTKGGPSGLPDI